MHQTISEESIAELVDTFYGRIRGDRLLGPIFEQAIGEDWEPHLDKMKAFWSTVLLASGSYKGNPMISHLLLPRLTQRHFDRWLELWRETVHELCAEDIAPAFIQKAQSIGDRLLYAISTHHQWADRGAA